MELTFISGVVCNDVPVREIKRGNYTSIMIMVEYSVNVNDSYKIAVELRGLAMNQFKKRYNPQSLFGINVYGHLTFTKTKTSVFAWIRAISMEINNVERLDELNNKRIAQMLKPRKRRKRKQWLH